MVVLRPRHTASGVGGRVIVLYFPFRQASPKTLDDDFIRILDHALAPLRICEKVRLILLGDEAKRVVRVLVALRFLSGRKNNLFPGDLFVRNSA